MNEHFWQGIFVDYEPATSNYYIYNPVKRKVQVVHSVNVNKNNLFDYSQISFKEFADEEWQEWNNNEFGNPFPNINNPLPNQMEEDFIDFPYLIMSLPTPSLTSLQTSSDSNKSNEDTASVGASDFKHVNIQSKDIKSIQSPSGLIKEEAGEPLADSLALLSIILTHQSNCTQSSVKYNISNHFSNI